MKRLLMALTSVLLCLTPQAFCQKILTTIQIGGITGTPAINTATNMIYVPNTTTGAVAVIDGRTNKIVTNIPVGVSPVYAAVNSNTNEIYVGGGQDAPYIAVIDGSSNTVTETVPVPIAGPMSVNVASNLVYFVSGGSDLSVLDGATNQVTRTLAVTKSCCLRTVAYSAVTNNLYSYLIPNSLVIVNANSLKFSTVQFPQIQQLGGLAVDSTSERLYLSDSGETAVYVVNGHTGGLSTEILEGMGYGGPIAVNPTSHLLADFGYSTASPNPFLSFVSGRNYGFVGNQVLFPPESSPYAIASGADGRYYVTFYQRDGIAVVSGPQHSTEANRVNKTPGLRR